MIKDKLAKAVSRLWTGRCDVINYTEAKKNGSNITDIEEVKVYEDIPCRISFESVKKAQQTEPPAKGEQEIKLFVTNDIEISEGSKIVVTQNGVKREYKSGGVSAVYSAHQEIALEKFKEWC